MRLKQILSQSEIDAFWTVCDVVNIWNECHFACPNCGSSYYSFHGTRLLLRCRDCRHSFSPKSTAFKSCKLPYTKLVTMLDLYFEGKNPHQIHILAKINYRSASLFVTRCKNAIMSEPPAPSLRH